MSTSNKHSEESLEHSKTPEPAHAIQLFNFDEKGTIVFNREEVIPILSNPIIQKKKVCVISIAGALRQGKSFILNFFIRYLHLICSNKLPNERWLRPEDGPLSGFSWKPGTDRHTLGILMWSEVFLVNIPDTNQEIAVIILDTQGTFDNETTVTECASIFALSVLLSSLQIYNLKENIKQDDLSHLQLFSGYGRVLFRNKSNSDYAEPFQKLLFLVRDWQWSEEKKGFEGGRALVKTVFDKLERSGKSELITLKDSIVENFEEISCFLLPHPGKAVATKLDFRGNIHEIEPEFRDQIEHFISKILAPSKLSPKTVNNDAITVEGLVDLIEAYWSYFRNGEVPTLKTAYLATAEADHKIAFRKAIDTYRNLMKNCRSTEQANSIKTQVLQNFRAKNKLGDSAMTQRYTDNLDIKLNNIFYDEYKSIIEERSFFYNVESGIVGGVASTTAVLGASGLMGGMAVADVIIACGVLGLSGLAIGTGVAIGGYKLSRWTYNKFAKKEQESTATTEAIDDSGSSEFEDDVKDETGHMEKYEDIEEKSEETENETVLEEEVVEQRKEDATEVDSPVKANINIDEEIPDMGTNDKEEYEENIEKREGNDNMATTDIFSSLIGFLIGVIVILAIVIEWLWPFETLRNK